MAVTRFPSQAEFSKAQIDASLDEPVLNAPTLINVSYRDTGSDLNYFSYVQQIARKHKKIFRHTEPAARVAHQKKILYCGAGDAPLAKVELAYFNGLIKYRTLYLRIQDEHGKHRIKGPYRSLHEFLKDRQKAPASKREVRQSLGEHRYSPDSFIILDQSKYNEILSRLPQLPKVGEFLDAPANHPYQWIEAKEIEALSHQSPVRLDLSGRSRVQFSSHAGHVDNEKIKIVHLTFPTLEDIKEILILFPNVDTIEVSDANQPWVNHHLASIGNQSCIRHVVLIRFQEESLEVPAAVNLHQLTVKGKSQLDFKTERGTKIQSLVFKSEKSYSEGILKCDLSHLPTLQALEMSSEYNHWRVKLTPPNNNHLQRLTVVKCSTISPTSPEAVNFRAFPELTHFIVKDSNRFLSASFLNTSWFDWFYGTPHPKLNRVELNDPSVMDLTQYDNIHDYVDALKIKKIIFNAHYFSDNTAFNRLIQKFSNTETIEVRHANQQWIRQYFPIIKRKLNVDLHEFSGKRMVIPAESQLNKLTISSARALRTITSQANGVVNCIKVHACNELSELDISPLSHRVNLIFGHCATSIRLIVKPGHPFTLEARYCRIVCPDLLLMSGLEKFILSDTWCSSLAPASTDQQLPDGDAQDIENHSKHALKHIEVNHIRDKWGYRDYDKIWLNYTYLPKLEKVILGENLEALLPPGVVAEAMPPTQTYRYTKTYDQTQKEIWLATGERKTTLTAEDTLDDIVSYREPWRNPAMAGPLSPQENKFYTVPQPYSQLERFEFSGALDGGTNILNFPHRKHLKYVYFNISIPTNMELFTIDLRYCTELRELIITPYNRPAAGFISPNRKIKLDLHGCHHLHRLKIDGTIPIDIEGLEECSALHAVNLKIPSVNRYQTSFPAECVNDLVENTAIDWDRVVLYGSLATLGACGVYLLYSYWDDIIHWFNASVGEMSFNQDLGVIHEFLQHAWEGITQTTSSMWHFIVLHPVLTIALPVVTLGLIYTLYRNRDAIAEINWLRIGMYIGCAALGLGLAYGAYYLGTHVNDIMHWLQPAPTPTPVTPTPPVAPPPTHPPVGGTPTPPAVPLPGNTPVGGTPTPPDTGVTHEFLPHAWEGVTATSSSILHFIVLHPVLISVTVLTLALIYMLYKNREAIARFLRAPRAIVSGPRQLAPTPAAPIVGPMTEEKNALPEASKQNPFAPDEEEPAQAGPSLTPDEISARKKIAYDKFYNALIKTTERIKLTSIVSDLLKADKKPSLVPLIELKDNEDPMAVDEEIIRQLDAEQADYHLEHHLYVDSPDEFLDYYKSGKLGSNQIEVEEKGTLDQFLSDKINKKILVINLSNFSAKDRIGFQSLLDIPPYITVGDEGNSKTFDIPDNIQVVLLEKDIASLGEAYRSRCQPYVLNSFFSGPKKAAEPNGEEEKLYNNTETIIPDEKRTPKQSFQRATKELDEEEKEIKSLDDSEDSDNNAIATNLYNNPAWEEGIGLEIVREGQGIQFNENTPFWNAWRIGKPLIITRPPDDQRFRRFLHRINVERKVDLLTGRLEDVPKGFSIQIKKDNTTPLLKLENVHVYNTAREEEKFKNHQKIVLGIQDFHRFYKEITVDTQTHNAVPGEGLLSTFDPDKQVFYITSLVTKCYWEKLMATIQANPAYSNKTFNFILAPGAGIMYVNSRAPLPIQPKEQTQKQPSNDEIKRPASDSEEKETKSTDKPNVYLSNDPAYLAETLAKDANSLVIDVHPTMSFGDLMDEIECKEGGGFTYSERAVLKELRTEKEKPRGLLKPDKVPQTIILNGLLSLTTYQQLLPYLLNSNKSHSIQIKRNGKPMTVSGTMILVMPEEGRSIVSGVPVQDYPYDWKDYHDILDPLDPKNKALLDKIQHFYALADKLPHQGDGRPNKPYRSYYRIVEMLEALKEDKPLHPENPIKDVFLYDYPKEKVQPDEMADYAYLNVIGKYLFCSETGESKSDPLDKLNKVKSLFKIKTNDDIRKHIWSILNCFSGKKIREILGEPLEKALTFYSFPSLTPAVMDKVIHEYHQHTQADEKKLTPAQNTTSNTQKLDRHEKQQNHLALLLKKINKKLIILKGPPGATKTHSVRHLLGGKDQYYEGEDEFIEWLKKGDRPFYVDEINMVPEDQLIVFGALRRGDKRVRYFNRSKRIDEIFDLSNHKPVIGTSNPERFGGKRHFSPILQDLATIIYYEEPSDEFYENVILNPRLGAPYKKYSKEMLFAFHLIKKYNEFIPRSIRDLKELVRHFKFLLNKINNPSENTCQKALLEVFEIQFASCLPAEDRKAFMNKLREHLNLLAPPIEHKDPYQLVKLTEKVSIPKSKMYLVNAIHRFLDMRLETLIDAAKEKAHEEKRARQEPHCQMLIMEGNSGIGKSTILRAAVDNHRDKLQKRINQLQLQLDSGSPNKDDIAIEIRVMESEIRKNIECISTGSADANTLLVTVQENEGIAIMDENMEDTESMTNQLLGGMNKDRKPVDKPGFAIMRSQNASSEENRPAASPAELNRALMVKHDDYSIMECRAEVKSAGLMDSEMYAKAYEDAKAEKPGEINMRTFRVILKAVAEEIRQQQRQTRAPQRADITIAGGTLSQSKSALMSSTLSNQKQPQQPQPVVLADDSNLTLASVG